jgi:hypothetical protein
MVKATEGGNGRELLLQDTSMSRVMQHMQQRSDLPASQRRQCRVLVPLVAMGANELADVVSANGKLVMSIHDLRHNYIPDYILLPLRTL